MLLLSGHEVVMAPTRFATVPLAELANKGLTPDAPPPPPLVLVVDDEPTIAHTLSLILQAAGFATTAANNGVDALEIARLTPPDLLLSDIVMPGMSGVELAQGLVAFVPECKLLLLSGVPQADDFVPIGMGQVKILFKPIEPAELLAEISLLLTPPGVSDPSAKPPARTAQNEQESRKQRRTGANGQ